MALYKVNHNNPSIAFFFNALFTAVTFSVILVFNDYVDDYLHKLDNSKCKGIAVAPIPNHKLGKTINDRLTRASANK